MVFHITGNYKGLLLVVFVGKSIPNSCTIINKNKGRKENNTEFYVIRQCAYQWVKLVRKYSIMIKRYYFTHRLANLYIEAIRVLYVLKIYIKLIIKIITKAPS